ncbi:MAG: hypothetical protein WBA18_11235 [Terracidiphilus sp.]
MTDFRTIKDAKDFLADRIAAEAARENVPLSEVERKMLYWSETDWTLSDKNEVGEEFEREYDQKEYEQKIARLIANIVVDRHRLDAVEEEKWDAAVAKLSDGDHYLSVLIGNVHLPSGGFVPMFYMPTIRPKNDFLKLLLTAFLLVPVFIGLAALSDRFFASRFWLSTGWKIPDRDKDILPLVILTAIYFFGTKISKTIRARSNRL